MARRWLAALVLAVVFGARVAPADETCMSPYLPKITGQEDYVYVWTLGIDGVGDGSDKLVTIGAKPGSPEYGKVVSSVPVGGRHEAHHAGFTDDRRYLWAGGLDDSKIFVFDVATDPAKPKLVKTIDTFVNDSGGVVGPHTFFALPGRMLIAALSNAKDERRPDGARRVQQRRQVHPDPLDAGGRRVRLRRARAAAPEPHADVVLHRQDQLHDGLRRSCSPTRRR